MNAITDLDLLLIGKTGNGKSHTGNSILKRKAFVSKSSATSVTTEVNYEVSEYKGRIIKVVDGPGVGDTRMDNQKAVQLVIKAMDDAIRMNPRGYHAFLLVVRFGGRFTQEDVDTIKFLKDVFGQDFVKRFCILVMTCGDSFEYESEDTGQTFQQWCSAQTGVFKHLLEECAGRIVLFNNVTRNEAEKDAQIDRLINIVNGLATQGHRYTNTHFDKASADRQRAIVESKKPVLREETMQECSLILQNLEKIRNQDNPQTQLKNLEGLLQRASQLLKTIKDQDKGTKALHDIEDNVNAIIRSITEAINVHKKVQTEKEALKKQEAEMKARMDQEMQRQKEEFDRQMDDEKRTWEERREREQELDRQRQEMEEERRKANEKRMEELREELEEEKERLRKQTEELERQRKRIKEESNKNWLQKLVGGVLKIFGF